MAKQQRVPALLCPVRSRDGFLAVVGVLRKLNAIACVVQAAIALGNASHCVATRADGPRQVAPCSLSQGYGAERELREAPP